MKSRSLFSAYFVLFSSLSCAFIASVGCGSLAKNTDTSPTIATLNGELDNPSSLEVSGNVRVAVLWVGQLPNQFSVSQDLPVQPVFPSQFVIQLDGPPPAAAMTPASAADDTGDPLIDAGIDPNDPSKYAVGTVVAYLDNNGNGKLDLVSETATQAVDQIIGANPNFLIAYFQGTITSAYADGLGKLPPLGYSLMEVGLFDAGTCPTPLPPNSTCDINPGEWVPISTLYPLALSNDPDVGRLICQDPDPIDDDAGAPTPTLPAAGSPGLVCSADGQSYTYTTCTSPTPSTLCRNASGQCTTLSATKSTSQPGFWPCP